MVLTPGSFNETYFEHSYLARQLCFPLVEGHDLTVRNESVYLKTLAGLKRVHAILRRLDDDFCDPVELRVDSALGVPGLLSAIRKGNVTLANALGSGVMESAAWLGFLPAIAQELIGERLSLPSVAIPSSSIDELEGAGPEPGEPVHGGLGRSQSVWYRLNPDRDEVLDISSCGFNGADTVVAEG